MNKNTTPGTTKFSDHEVIVVPNRLRKAIKQTSSNEHDPIVDAEVALSDLSAQFGNWMVDECAQLETARQRLHTKSLSPASRAQLFRAAHDIRGHGGTFGYPMAADVADSLCRLIERMEDGIPAPLALIDQCVDAVRAIIRERHVANAERTAAELAKGLRALTDEFLGKCAAIRGADAPATTLGLAPEQDAAQAATRASSTYAKS